MAAFSLVYFFARFLSDGRYSARHTCHSSGCIQLLLITKGPRFKMASRLGDFCVGIPTQYYLLLLFLHRFLLFFFFLSPELVRTISLKWIDRS